MVKRLFDVLFSILVLSIVSWFLIICYIVASIETKSSGLFIQKRIGQNGKPFKIFKLKTMYPNSDEVTFSGKYLRKFKIDELPQFFNVLLGQMSVVGPRPDVEGYYDTLQGENRKILQLKPGITSESAIKYKNEEAILEKQENPKLYNDEVIFPDKIKMNLEYYYKQSFVLDVKIILKTIKNLIS